MLPPELYTVAEIATFSKLTLRANEHEFVDYLDTGNLTEGLIQSLEHYSDLSKLPSRAKKIVIEGDILFSTVRPNNRHYGIIHGNSKNLVVSTGFSVIRANRNIVLPEYLYYHLTSNSTVELLQSIAEQSVSAYPSINDSDIGKLEFKIPDTQIQKAVIKIIESINQKLSINREINANLHDQIFSEFQYVRKSNKLNEVVLMDLCSFISRGVSPKYENNTGYWVLGQTCIRNHIVSMNNARTLISKDYGDKTVHKGDILVNSTGVGSLGRVAQLWFEHPHLVADSHISIVRPKISYEEYLGCFMMSIEDEIENMAEGSTGQTELPRRSLMQMMISIPEMDVLKSFGEKVRPLFDLMYKNLEINEKLTKIRDTLLPKLMSGEIDVSQLDLGD